MNDVKGLVFRRKKITVTTVVAAKPAVKKLLTASTNAVLEKEERDGQNVSVKKI